MPQPLPQQRYEFTLDGQELEFGPFTEGVRDSLVRRLKKILLDELAELKRDGLGAVEHQDAVRAVMGIKFGSVSMIEALSDRDPLRKYMYRQLLIDGERFDNTFLEKLDAEYLIVGSPANRALQQSLEESFPKAKRG